MNDSFDRNFQDRNRWRGASLEARFRHMDTMYIKHGAVRRILNFIDRELVARQADGRTSGLLIIAPSGAGKTALIKHLINKFPKEVTDEYSTCPVVSFTVPTMPSPKTMGAAFLKGMGDVLWNTGTAGGKLDRIRSLLGQVQTKLVLIDNFQDIPTRRKSRGVLNVATWLRDLCDVNFGGLVIVLGTTEAAQVRDANEQVQRRIKARLTLPVFSAETKEELLEFARLLRGIEKNLPLAEESEIYRGDQPRRIHFATRGNFDYLTKLLKRSIKIASERSQECLTVEILHDAFQEEHQDYAVAENPFSPDFLWTKLDQPGQVFHNVSFSIQDLDQLEVV